MKVTPPRSRTRWTHPSNIALAPTSSVRSAPHVWVRAKLPKASAIRLYSLLDERPGFGASDGLLLARPEILDRHVPLRTFIVSKNRHKSHASGRRVFELLAQLLSLRVDVHPQAGAAEIGGQRERIPAREI